MSRHAGWLCSKWQVATSIDGQVLDVRQNEIHLRPCDGIILLTVQPLLQEVGDEALHLGRFEHIALRTIHTQT